VEKIKCGDIIQHRLQREWLMVVAVESMPGSAQKIKCRTKRLEVKEFNRFELEPLSVKDIKKAGKRL
jgi:hypothetical protein